MEGELRPPRSPSRDGRVHNEEWAICARRPGQIAGSAINGGHPRRIRGMREPRQQQWPQSHAAAIGMQVPAAADAADNMAAHGDSFELTGQRTLPASRGTQALEAEAL